MRRGWVVLALAAGWGCEEEAPSATPPVSERATPRPGVPPPAADSPPPARADAAPSVPTPGVDAAPPPVDPPAPVDCAPVATPPRLLTRAEYDATVRDLLGDDTAPAAAFPAENRVLGFDNNAEAHQATPLLVEAWLEAGEKVATRAVQRGARALTGCDPEAAGCVADWLQTFGRRAFRRPLSASEHAAFVALFDAVRAEADAATALQVTLTALLQSPQFLYRLDRLAPDEVPGEPTRVEPYAMATRLAYFLWGTTPDDALLDAARDGQLDGPAQVDAMARAMLDDPRAREAVRRFHHQWLGLDQLDDLVKDDVADIAAVRAGLRTSIERFVDHVFWQDGTFAALLDSPVVFVDADLGAELGIEGGAPGEFVGVELPGERAGLLTQPALLARLAHADQTSPIRRGIFVREMLLCQPLPPPPNDVVIEPPSPDPNATTRERFAQHTADRACAGCHQQIDPLGFGFEAFDHLGRFRTTENGLPIDTSGNVVGPRDRALAGPFDGVPELATRLGASDGVRACVATQWFRYALARAEQDVDACALDGVLDAFAATDGSLRELLVALAVSDAFGLRPGAVVGDVQPLPPLADAPPPAPPEGPPDAGRAPIGFLDRVTLDGLAVGWAFDPDTPVDPTTLELWLDGGPGVGQFLAQARTGVERPDVNAAYPDAPGDHGFRVLLPDAARDGRDHTLTVLALGHGADDDDTVLNNAGLAFRAGLNADTQPEPGVPNAFRPQGFVDAVRPDGQVCGWALDRDVTGRPLEVDVWIDGAPGVDGVHAGTARTGLSRPDVVDAIGHPGDHGFCLALPAALRDGREHTLSAFAFEAGHPGNTVLNNSPFRFTLEPR